MKNLLLGIFVLIIALPATGQSSLEGIISSSRDFSQIIRQGEEYFTLKHPGRSPDELVKGEFRDGEYVKFRRWQAFWSERLNPDGTLGDISLSPKIIADQESAKSASPYANVPWTEINYTNYITGQIGLGRTTSLGFHPTDVNTFYVGAAIGGIWKTTDGGQSYVPLGDDLPFLAVSAIVVSHNNPNTIYIAISDHVGYGPSSIGVYKSTNGGSTWASTSLTFSFSQNIRVYAMVSSPANAQEIYVATSAGLYKTTDGFASVNQQLTGDCRDVRLKPGSPSTVYVGMADGRVVKSTNNGSTFSQTADFGGSPVFLAVSPMNNQLLYARHGNSLHQSLDSGDSFPTTRTMNENNEVFVIAPGTTNTILSGNFECNRSDNGGTSFRVITNWLGNNGLPLIHVDQRNMFVNPLENDAVYYCNDGGLYRYTISSETWENLSHGLAITQYYDIAVSQTDANIIGGGSQDNGNVYRQSNGSWLQYASTGDGMNQEIDPTNADIRYWAYQFGDIRRWQNGVNYNIKPSGTGNGAWETPYKIDPSNPNRLVIGYNKVWESLDRGNTWNTISGSLSGGNMNELAIAPSNGERIYVSSGGTLFVKNTSNDTWTTRSLPNGSISDIEVDQSDMNKVYVSVPGYSNGNKIYVSDDAGASWTNITANLPNTSVGALELYNNTPGGIFVGTDIGVYYKDDQLSNWVIYGDLPNTRVEDIEIQYAAELIRVGTHGRGVLEAQITIQGCNPSSPDQDGDGVCDLIDFCPGFDNDLIGTPCDDGDAFSSGEMYDSNCGCSGGLPNLSYCAGAGSSGTGSDYIDYVLLNGVENSSGQTFYSDFRNITIPLEGGQSYTLTVSLNYAFPPDRIYAWIDWNRNAVFEATEMISLSVPSASANHTSTGTVMIPPNAQDGLTTMRVRVVYSTSFNDPCGNTFGEVEDYAINVSCDGSCTSLPLEWGQLSARPLDNKHAYLEWMTQNESDVSHFRIERSVDAQRFVEIGIIGAQNQSVQSYTFLDSDANTNIAYYRIVAVDEDGTEDISPIRTVIWQEKEYTASIYPNPTDQNGITLKWDATSGHRYQYKIYNSYGQEVAQGDLGTAAGPREAAISTKDLTPGFYILRLGTKSWLWTQGFVIE